MMSATLRERQDDFVPCDLEPSITRTESLGRSDGIAKMPTRVSRTPTVQSKEFRMMRVQCGIDMYLLVEKGSSGVGSDESNVHANRR